MVGVWWVGGGGGGGGGRRADGGGSEPAGVGARERLRAPRAPREDVGVRREGAAPSSSSSSAAAARRRPARGMAPRSQRAARGSGGKASGASAGGEGKSKGKGKGSSATAAAAAAPPLQLPPYERACGGKGSRPAAGPPAALSAEDVSASGRGLWLVRGVLPAGACATLCAAAEPSLRACGSRGPAFGEAARRHTRAEADDTAAAAFARALWERSGLREALAGVLPAEIGGRAPVGLSRRLRVYSYDERGSEHFGRCVCARAFVRARAEAAGRAR